jgi:hypothetical protein
MYKNKQNVGGGLDARCHVASTTIIILSVQSGLERSLKRDLGRAVPGAKVSEPALNHLDQSAQMFVAKNNGPIALSHQHGASGSQSPLFVVDGASPEDFDEVWDTDPSICDVA